MSLNQTHSSERVNIVFVGKRNSGKSSLINALTGQNVSIVSDHLGTTTDPVRKVMEIGGLGPCVVTDTAGFDDVGDLGAQRVEKTVLALRSADVTVVVFSSDSKNIDEEKAFVEKSGAKNVIYVMNKSDSGDFNGEIPSPFVKVSTKNGDGIEDLKRIIKKVSPEKIEETSITGHLVKKGDTVLLVMPQDESAPKGRLILPQVQVIRDLLDNGANPICAMKESLNSAIDALKSAPKLVICDSQVFDFVDKTIPKEWKLTSFSVLLAGFKGDIKAFTEGAKHIGNLGENSKVLIAEACSHTTTDADIARVKIPNLLHKKINPSIDITVVSGNDFPDDVSAYDLVIHCGGCMFNKAHVMSRYEICKKSNVPMTNYGIAIAYLTGILDRIV